MADSNSVYRFNRCKVYVFLPGYLTPIECKTNVCIYMKKCYKKANAFLWEESEQVDYFTIERVSEIDEKMLQLAKDTRTRYLCGYYPHDELWKYEVHFHFVPFSGVVNHKALGCLIKGMDEKLIKFKPTIFTEYKRYSNKD